MNTNEIENSKKKGNSLKSVFLVMVVVAIISLIGFAFARYITRINGNAQVPIASWNFSVTAGSEENLSIDLADTRDANDNTEVDPTKVAPGTKGALVFNIDASRKSSFIRI